MKTVIDILVEALPNVLVAIAAALLATFVTGRYAHKRTRAQDADRRAWEEAQKRLQTAANDSLARRERSLAAAEELYRVYGLFFATWKSWNAMTKSFKRAAFRLPLRRRRRTGDTAEMLHQNKNKYRSEAASVEGSFETLIVRITAEYSLGFEQRVNLWALRLAFKRLRYAIDAGKPLEWWRTEHSTPSGLQGYREYQAFKYLTAAVASITVDGAGMLPSISERCAALRQITGSGREFDERFEAIFTVGRDDAKASTEAAVSKPRAGRKSSDWVHVAERFDDLPGQRHVPPKPSPPSPESPAATSDSPRA